jgi:hypothetical protein
MFQTSCIKLYKIKNINKKGAENADILQGESVLWGVQTSVEQLWHVKMLLRIPSNGPRKCCCHLSCSLWISILFGVRILQLGDANASAREWCSGR